MMVFQANHFVIKWLNLIYEVTKRQHDSMKNGLCEWFKKMQFDMFGTVPKKQQKTNNLAEGHIF